MTLEDLLYKIGETAIKNKIINFSAVGGDVYDLNVENIKDYPVLFASPTGTHQVRENTTEYEVTFYFLDRLLSDDVNDVQIFSTAIEQLKLILTMVENIKGVLDVTDDYDIQNFTETERMNDRVAGAFATVKIMIQNMSGCCDTEFVTLMLKLENKTLNVTKNGKYTVTYNKMYDGLRKVEVDVNVDVETPYQDGFADGKEEGLEQGYVSGKQDGIAEGYESGKEDGLTEGYAEGKADGIAEGAERGKELAAQEAIVLNVTENGSYYTKYADIPEWTETETGDDFYSYASVSYVYFDTEVKFSELTDFEFWYRFTDEFGTNGPILGRDVTGAVFIEKTSTSNDSGHQFRCRLNGTSYTVYLQKDIWHVFKYSEGILTADGVEVVSLYGSLTDTSNIMFNGHPYSFGSDQKSGEYGMVKINGRVIVPDSYSFKWRDTGEYLPFFTNDVTNVNYKFIFNNIEKPLVSDELFKEVNVSTKIDVAALNLLPMKETKMDKIPEVFDFSGVKNFAYAFYQNRGLKDISALRSATNPILSVNNMFSSSSYAFDLSPLEDWDVSKCTDFGFCFSNGQNTDFTPLAKWDTSKGTIMGNFIQMNIYTVPEVIKIPALRCDSANALSQSIVRFNSYTSSCPRVEIGGFINLKSSMTQNDGIASCPNITYDSCLNILNGLYDFNVHNETPTSTQGKLKVNQAFLDLVGDNINIAINKNWTITV